MATQNLLKLLLLLKLVMRDMSTTVWCKFGGLTLVIKLSFYSDFEIRFQGLFKILKLKFRRDFEVVPDWGTMIACHMKAKYIYTYAG